MNMKYLGIWFISDIHAWLFILCLLVYIVERYILYLLINYMSIANYTTLSLNMTWYDRNISLWPKSVKFYDIFWILLVFNTLSCIRCLSWAILYFALLSKILKQNTLPSKLFNKMPLCTLFFYFFLFHLHYYALFFFI
jgi:hypothetical protein